MAQAITVTDIRKNFGAVEALKGVSLDVAEGEKVVVIGPSGSGKSVLIRCINGLEVPDSGTVVVEGMNLSDRKVNARALARDVAMVFQSYNLYPHKTVLENVTLAPIKVLKVPREQAERDGRAYLERVGLSDKVDKYPDQLSGGQQQRVAIARALVKNPRLLLLDEPLSNLDARLRLEMREEIRRIQQRTGVTTIFVTHDQEEAMSISDRIVLMKLGVLQQNDLPQNLYDQPANQFVADFLGNPPINNLRGVVKGGRFELEDGSASCDCSLCAGAGEGRRVTLALRAESAVVGQEGPLSCEVTSIYQMGKEEMAYLRFGNSEFRAYISVEDGLKRGQKVNVALRGRGVFLFDTETGERIA